MDSAVFSTFGQWSRRRPDSPFLQLPDGTVWTYGQAFDRSARIANLLLAEGVQKGDRIAVQVEKSVETVLLYLASLRIGAVYLPLNTAYTAPEIRYFLEDARPVLFIHRPGDERVMAALCAQVGVPRRLTLGVDGKGTLAAGADAQAPHQDAHEVQPDDLAAILYTSGTTGRSKGAMLTHRNLASNAATLATFWGFTESDRLLHALPIFHVHGLFVAINTTIVAGSSLLMLPRFETEAVLRTLPAATVMMGVPTFYMRLLTDPGLDRKLVEHIRLFISGSAPLSAETHKAFSMRTGHAILERYGMTETNMNTSNPYEGRRVPGSVGLPLPGIEIRITDPETGADLSQGDVGMIEVRGPNVFKGYWEQPEKTRDELRPNGFFITGDLGMIDAEGYVSLVGRARDLIICGGYNVYPAEVEALLDAIPGVGESAVIGVPHADMGEGVVAVVRTSDAELDEARVLQALDGQLARFKQPRRVVFLPELPRNAMGKIQKKDLRDRFARLLIGDAAQA